MHSRLIVRFNGGFLRLAWHTSFSMGRVRCRFVQHHYTRVNHPILYPLVSGAATQEIITAIGVSCPLSSRSRRLMLPELVLRVLYVMKAMLLQAANLRREDQSLSVLAPSRHSSAVDFTF